MSDEEERRYFDVPSAVNAAVQIVEHVLIARILQPWVQSGLVIQSYPHC